MDFRMEKERNLWLTVLLMMVNGQKEKPKVTELKFWWVERFLKDFGMVQDLSKENVNSVMDKFMMESGMKANQKVLDQEFGLMDDSIKASGIRVDPSEKE